MKRWAFAVIATAAISGCTERQGLQSPPIGRPVALILDGAHNGDPDFFFLPPLVGNPINDPHFDAGKFDATLTPTVEVCRLKADPRPAPTFCEALVFGPVNAPLDLSNQQYQFNWDTKSPTLLDPTKFYRIRVRGAAGKSVLGSLDVDPVDQGMKNLKTGDVVQFQDGRTLPIRFRIEQGERCTFSDDCTTQLVGAGGATIITSEAGGGLSIPGGALDVGEEIAVTIAKVAKAPGQRCLAQLDVTQFEGCYGFTANPPLSSRTNNPGRFNVDVVAAICVEVPLTLTVPQEGLLQLHAFDAERGLRALANASVGFLPCEGTRFPPPPPIGATPAWGSILDRLATLVGPKSAFAAMVHLGVGGRTCCFSDITWGLPSKMSVFEGDGQTGTAGLPVETPPAVLVTDVSNNPVAGATIHFRVTSGGGSVTPASVVTGASGIAQVTSWVIGPGANTLEAFATGIGPAPDFPVAPDKGTDAPVPEGVVTFTATATGLGTPELVAPINGAVIEQNNPNIGCTLSSEPTRGFGFQILFDWTDVAADVGVAGYELLAQHEGAALPIVNTFVQGASQYTLTSCNSFVQDAVLTGWQWRVRAKDTNGNVGPWTEMGAFVFAPCRLTDESECRAP